MARKTSTSTAELNLDEQPADAVVIAEASKTQGTDIVEYQPHEAAIIGLEKRFNNVVFDVSTTAGLADAKAARVEIRDVRYALQKTTKDVIVPYQDEVKKAQARVNQVKEFGASLGERVLKIEEPVDEVIKAEEKRQKDEKERLEQIERERVEKIQNKLTHFRSVAGAYAIRNAADIAEMLERVKVAVILPEDYAEFEGEATIARDNAIDQLEALHTAAVDRELAAKKLADQQRELEELRQKQKVADDEAQRLREERAEEDRKRLKQQQDELDQQRRDLEAQQRQQREQQEEQQRQQRARDEQHQRDQEELTRLRALAANPAPVAAAAPVLAATAIDVPPVTASKPEPEQSVTAACDPAPAAQDIVEVVAVGFDVSNDVALEWLRAIQF